MYRLQGKTRSNGSSPGRANVTIGNFANLDASTALHASSQDHTIVHKGKHVPVGKADIRAMKANEWGAREGRASELRAREFGASRFLRDGSRTGMDSGITAWILLPYIPLPGIRLPRKTLGPLVPLPQAPSTGRVQSSTVSPGTCWKSRRFLLINFESLARAMLAIRRSNVPKRRQRARSDEKTV
jgi:hypothetical protein